MSHMQCRAIGVLSAVVAALAFGTPAARAGEDAPRTPDDVRKLMTREVYALRTAEGRAKSIGGPGGTTKGSEAAVEAGLAWLAKTQEADGSWLGGPGGDGPRYEVGITGLALMAFLGAGYTHADGPHKAAVAKGLDWLKANQAADGSFPKRRSFYEQGIAAIALGEAYALTQDKAVRPAAERAILFIAGQQPEHGGFRYQGGTTEKGGDLSVSGWQMIAMITGFCGGVETVPEQAITRSRALLKSAYRQDGGSVYVVGGGDNTTVSMTAVGALCRQFLGGPEADREIQASVDYLDTRGRRVGNDGRALVGDLYYTYYSCLALFQAGGKYWERWNKAYRTKLVEAQEKREADAEGRFVQGSWDPAIDAFGKGAGRVYTTAMAVLCLETPYRYARLPRTPVRQPADF